MTEPSTSHVEQQVQQRIAAARVRIQAARERRASFAEARKAGLRRRHAAKLRRLAEAEQPQRQDDGQEDDQVIPHPHRQKGAAPQLGARHEGEPGPFGQYGDDGQDDDADDGQQHDQGGEA